MTVELADAGPVPATGWHGRLDRQRLPGAAAGKVTLWPAGTDRPARATVSFDAWHARQRKDHGPTGERRRRAVAVAGGPTDLTLDVAGYTPAANPPRPASQRDRSTGPAS